MSTILSFFNLAVVYALCLLYELCSLMVFDHLCTACTEHSFAAYLWPTATMRCAYLMSYAHRAQLRCLCATLIVIHDEYDSRPYEPVTSFQQPKEVTKTKWSGTILNIQRMTRRAKYRMYFVKAALQQVTYLGNWHASPVLPALLYLPTSMLVACASRLTLVVKTRSRRGFHLNGIHVINPV